MNRPCIEVTLLAVLTLAACRVPGTESVSDSSFDDTSLDVRFDERRGQIEAGGPFAGVEFRMYLGGSPAHISVSGEGPGFRSIRVDGHEVASAVLPDRASEITLVRGRPRTPYLASADARVESVRYDRQSGVLTVTVAGMPGARVALEMVAPARPGGSATATGMDMLKETVREDEVGVATVVVTGILSQAGAEVRLKTPGQGRQVRS